MDGTLLGLDHKVAPRTLEAIHMAQEQGIRFMIATGRNFRSAMEELEELDLECDYLVGSGAEVRNPQREVVLQTPIPIEVCEELYRQLIKFPVSIIFSTDDFDYRIGTEEEIEESIVEQIHLFHLDLEPEKIRHSELYERICKATRRISDFAELKEGKFTFKGEVDQPLLFGLATEDMNYPVQFFVENTNMDVRISNDGETITVRNSPVNTIFQENAEKVFEEGYDIDSLITKYPASPAAAFYLYRYFTYQLPLDELKATRAKISSELAGCPYVKDLDGIIKQLENVQIGKVAPEFSLPDTAGVSVSLSDFRGKYVLLDFWASWCPPCRRENPNVVKAFNEYKDKNFTIVGISLDKDKSKWMKAIADDNLAWTHLSDLKYWDSEIPALYGVRGIPANVLLDPDGGIVAKNITGEDLHKKLKEVIK